MYLMEDGIKSDKKIDIVSIRNTSFWRYCCFVKYANTSKGKLCNTLKLFVCNQT